MERSGEPCRIRTCDPLIKRTARAISLHFSRIRHTSKSKVKTMICVDWCSAVPP